MWARSYRGPSSICSSRYGTRSPRGRRSGRDDTRRRPADRLRHGHTIDSSLDIAAQIDEIHRQGGIAIAAHPAGTFWKGFEPVMDRLDGTEICHPAIYQNTEAATMFEQFAWRTSSAAIGSSDFHGFGRLGLCRTFVFARDTSAGAIVDAVRAQRTVVYGSTGKRTAIRHWSGSRPPTDDCRPLRIRMTRSRCSIA